MARKTTSLGRQLRQVRDDHQAVLGEPLTQAAVARALDVPVNTVARWEREERTPQGLYAKAVLAFIARTRRAIERGA